MREEEREKTNTHIDSLTDKMFMQMEWNGPEDYYLGGKR